MDRSWLISGVGLDAGLVRLVGIVVRLFALCSTVHHARGVLMRMTDLREGWTVVGNDGGRVGTLRGVTQNYVITSRPGPAADLYIPASFIANVEHETIHLNITQRDVKQMGWERAPRDDELETEPTSDLQRHV